MSFVFAVNIINPNYKINFHNYYVNDISGYELNNIWKIKLDVYSP
jgi:hypothetical protein